MTTGIIHGHSGLAYLLVLSSVISFGLAVANAALGSRPGLVRVGAVLQRRVEPALMGLIGLLGIGAWWALSLPLTLPYLWAGVAAVVVQGVLIGRGTKPVLLALAAGDTAQRWRWPVFAGVHLALVLAIFAAMLA